MTEPRIPLNASVQHRDAPSSAPVGILTRRIKPSVGAPRMVRVQWTERYSAPVNERNLRAVDTRPDWA